MKAVIDKRNRHFSLIKQKNERINKIEKQQILLREYVEHGTKVTDARLYYAASKICSLVRGFLSRRGTRKLRQYHRALRLVQKVIRGKLGRIRWKREYWMSKSVVKSTTALQEITARSTLIREKGEAGKYAYYWIEYFDPLSDSFWYFNKVTKQNTWEVPYCFQSDLICTWEGFDAYGGSTRGLNKHNQPCRAVLRNMQEYQNHMRLAHRWFCVACYHGNPGLTFPKCSLCGNSYDENGIDGEKVMKESFDRVKKTLQKFLYKDVEPHEQVNFVLQDRLIELALQHKAAAEEIEAIRNLPSNSSVFSDGATKEKLLADVQQKFLNQMKMTQTSKVKKQGNVIDAFASGLSLPPIPGATSKPSPLEKQSSNPKPRDTIKGLGTMSELGDTGFQNENYLNNQFVEAKGYKTAKLEAVEKEWVKNGGMKGEEERFRDPITKGLFNETEFDFVTSIHDNTLRAHLQQDLLADTDTDEEEEDQGSQGNQSAIRSKLQAPKKEEKFARLLICEGFIAGTCSLTTCPLAHPGVRDSAVTRIKLKTKEDGTKLRFPYVYICPRANGIINDCPDGKQCRHFHVYVRPSTESIILALYPIDVGHKKKTFHDRAELTGNVKNKMFNGYGIMVWQNGSVYMGDWVDDQRDGLGIYRNKEGDEYVGQFKAGIRNGWGKLTSRNGDEYIGQWNNGKMEGAGFLTCSNGDSYRGYFHKNQYEGIGVYLKANGDVYFGYCKGGRAHGLGIQSLATGEKYKGYFEHNARHGRGACAYPNGSRFAGIWYRGAPEGFGLYITPRAGKYIGEWSAGKKHGQGRYIFPNGDFYDGGFHKNLAQGTGVYYHANGNIYTGQWSNDRRNGRGTYIFLNGSKYTGTWNDNDIHGKGRFDFAHGAYYRGEWSKNKKHGKGIYVFINGAEYKGMFENERFNGLGELKYMTGHRYVGNWVNNQKHGYGVMYYANGAIYAGNFVKDIRQGFGKLTLYPNSPLEESYEGNWENDLWHGKGKYCYRKDGGMTYDGDWDNGVRHGHGQLTFENGSYYRGEFKRDQMWGKGIYVGSDCTQYDGEWRANMRQGIGTSLEADGSIYHGEFFGNMKQGEGKIVRADGSAYTGRWDANTIVGGGRVTIPVRSVNQRDGLKKEVTLKVFGY